jgi:D-alanine-D-alanine ligase
MVRVALIVGGRGGEHEISLQSGAAVAAALDALGHSQALLVLTRDGRARFEGQDMSLAEALVALASFAPDCAFVGMHGEDGEDGRIQGLLDLLGIPYQGSGVRASAVTIDKALTKTQYRKHGLPVAADVTLEPNEPVDWAGLSAELGLPLVLKTAKSGSSVGIEVADTLEELISAGTRLIETTSSLVVEQWLPGREFTASIVEDEEGQPVALPIVEICPVDARFFDYEAKYTPGATDEICPAQIEAELTDELQSLGLQAHKILGCRHISRTDFKCDGEGRPLLLETNTLPGLTPLSLLPKAAAAGGLSFEALVDRLVRLALRDG